MKKFTVIATVLGFSMLSCLPAVQAAPSESSPPALTLPNPMIEYQTLPEMTAILGFTPLYLPHSSGYECTAMYIINDCIADLRFQNTDGEKSSSLTVRSARWDLSGQDDISGCYGMDWQESTISHSTVHIGQYAESTTKAAYWGSGRYVFALIAQDTNEYQFQNSLELLVDITEANYAN